MSDLYQKGKLLIVQNNLDPDDSSGIVLVPMSTSYSPDPDAHEFLSDINADELACDGYDGGFGGADRKTPANRTWNRDDANGRVEFDFDNITLAGLGGGVSANNDTIGYFVLAEERTADSDSPLIAWDDLQDDRATNGSDISYAPDAEGMFQIR